MGALQAIFEPIGRRAEWLATFVRQVRMQRAKKHGAARAPWSQAIFFARSGAHLSARGPAGKNPFLKQWRRAGLI